MNKAKKLNIRTNEDELTPEMANYAHGCYQEFVEHIMHSKSNGFRFGEIRENRTSKTYGTMYFNAKAKLNKSGSISVLVNNENKDG